MAINMQPSQLDDLFAADTPITPDPTPGPKASSKGYATREAMIARLVAAGYTAEEAAKVVDSELARSGPRPQGMFDQDNSPAGMENLRQGIANQRASERRMGIFEENYNDVTGAPAKPDIAPPKMAPDQVPLTAQQLREMGYNPFTEPGVNMPDGTRAARPRQLMTEREAAAYNTREQNGPGWYKPSGRDEAMMARGYMPVMGEDGTVSYRLGPGGEVDGLPGTPGRGGRRGDLEAQMRKADGTLMVDANGEAIPRFRVANMSGPLSENNSVYVQSDEARAKQAAYQSERQLYRDAAIQGVSPAALLAQSPGDYGDLTADGQRGRVNARVANEGARQAAADKREEAWRAQMMLGGGRPTGGIGGSKATVNAWLNLPEDQRASAMRYMLPGGQLSATVDANNAAQAGRMAQAAMTAFLNNNPQGTPLHPLQQQQITDKKTQERQAALQWAENHVSSNYAEPQGILNYLNRGAASLGLTHDNTAFTVAEQDKAIQALMTRYPTLTLTEATQIIDSVGATRTTLPRVSAAPAAPGSVPTAPPVLPPRGDL
jgi:hypothetical protein